MRQLNLECLERLLNRMSLEHLWNLLFLEVPERRCQAHPDILVNLWNQSLPEVLLILENQLNPVDQWNQLNLGHHLNQRYLEVLLTQLNPEVLLTQLNPEDPWNQLILETQLNPEDPWNQLILEHPWNQLILEVLWNQRNLGHHLNQRNPVDLWNLEDLESLHHRQMILDNLEDLELLLHLRLR
jgi:hypothetical protein